MTCHKRSTLEMICTLICLVALLGCSVDEDSASPGNSVSKPGGGGLGTGASPAPSQTATASGSLIVPPNHLIENEPNDTIAQAQGVTSGSTISGNAAAPDTGFAISGGVAQDLYSLSATRALRIVLTIAEDDLDANDLNLILMDSAGNEIETSAGQTSTEQIETPGAGDFLVGVQALQGASAYVLSFAFSGSLTSVQDTIVPPEAAFVPGEILVKRRANILATRQEGARFAASYGLTRKRMLPSGVELMRVAATPQAPQNQLPNAQRTNTAEALKALTLDRIRQLRRDPTVIYAEPNFLRQPALVPDDAFYDLQWHYPLVNLPQAWDVTTGSDNVIVAVIDTGVLTAHPDLGARLVSGFDFISDVINANDGDGLDPDPNDPGDDPQGQSSSFHGTHVSGTVGALTNNTTGVAGVTWQTRIMPLRVLGVDGGTDADIAQAIRYAAGLTNSSGTIPAEPADIINMSLSGPGESQTLQDAVNDARQQGVIVVAAAGNENVGTPQFPASLDGVIAVAAVDITSQKTSYSNFGANIDVAAPGGNVTIDLNGDDFGDGVLSTSGNDRGEFFAGFQDGTSMASPHVAGVIALMLAVNPNLTPTDIDQLLAGTHADTTRRITRDLGDVGRDDIFGHGLIDAAAAVIAASEIPGGIGNPPNGSILTVSISALNFENFLDSLSFEITNAGIGTLTLTSVSSDVPWITLTPSSGIAPLRVQATVDRNGLAAGTHTGTISVNSDASQGDTTATVRVEMDVGGTTQGDIGTVFVLVLDPNTFETEGQTQTTAAQNYAFRTSLVPPGTYLIVAGTDRDDDRLICEREDACGFFPELVTLIDGEDTPNLNFVVGELIAPQHVPPQLGEHLDGPFMRRR